MTQSDRNGAWGSHLGEHHRAVAAHPGGADPSDPSERHEFCRFHRDRNVECAGSFGKYAIDGKHIVVRMDDGERYFMLFRVDGRFYTVSHELGAVPLVRREPQVPSSRK